MATKKPFILLEGTPLQKKVYLENPQEPTADDLKLIQRLYGLPQGLDLKQTVDALNQLDVPVVMGCVLTIALIFIVINIVVDLIYAWLDPRIRMS